MFLQKKIIEATKDIGNGVINEIYYGYFGGDEVPYDLLQSRAEMVRCFSMTISVWGIDTALKISDTLIEVIKNMAEHVIFDSRRINYVSTPMLYMDFCSMVEQLNMQSRIKPYFKDSAELEMMHDELSSLIDATEDEVNMDAWERIKDNWEKWEFSDDDDFIVTAPQKPYDVAHEGINLHHCVKSYIPKIIARTTNIMFIRKKYSPDTPFFTVEITNNNVIQQVHGSCNRNTSTEPGLDDFISKWQKACGLSNFGYDKIR